MKYITDNDAKEHRAMLDAADKKQQMAIDAAKVEYQKKLVAISMEWGKDRYEANRWLESREFDKA